LEVRFVADSLESPEKESKLFDELQELMMAAVLKLTVFASRIAIDE
jgi:hypothetical protein